MSNLSIDNSKYLKYKFFNSLFLGISVGSYITIYSPLDIKTFSIGGIFLAVATAKKIPPIEKVLMSKGL